MRMLVVAAWMATAYLLYVPFPFMVMGLAFTTLVYAPSAGMIIHWSRIRW